MKKYKLKEWVKIAIIDILVNAIILIWYYWSFLAPYKHEIGLGDIFILVGLFLVSTAQINMFYAIWRKWYGT